MQLGPEGVSQLERCPHFRAGFNGVRRVPPQYAYVNMYIVLVVPGVSSHLHRQVHQPAPYLRSHHFCPCSPHFEGSRSDQSPKEKRNKNVNKHFTQALRYLH